MEQEFATPTHNVKRAALLAVFGALSYAGASFGAPAIPVAVTNTPSVNATVVGSVDAQGSARSAVSTFCYVQQIDETTGNSSCTLAEVPAGKILVIESLLCFAHVPTAIPFKTIILTMGAPNPMYPAAGNLSTVNHFLLMTPAPNGDYGGNHAYGLTTPIKLYAFGPALSNGGTVAVVANVQIGPYVTGGALATFGCSLAGVLEYQ